MKKSIKQYKQLIWSKRTMGSVVVVGALISAGVFGLNGYFGGGASIPEDTMSRGLVGYWSFDEGSGQTAYNAADTGSVNNGTLGSSASADSADPTWTSAGGGRDSASGGDPTSSAAGPSGSALDFDGTDDYVNCGSDSSLDITDAITIEAWVKAPTATVGTIVMWGETNTGKRRSLFLWNGGSGNGRLYWSGYGSAANIDSGIRIDDDIWHHCVVTKDSSDFVKTYVDGVAGNTGSVTLASYSFTGTHIGQNVGGTEPFNGSIDSVKIYNRALSAEEVRYHYNRGGPVSHWKFDEGEGSTAYNSTDNNNDGTLHLGSSGNTATSSAWVTGRYGTAIEFDGTDDYVEVPDHSSLDITGGITLATWINDPPPESFAQLEELEQELEEELTKPTILNALVDPTKVQPGDVMLVRAEIKDNYGIESVRADMGGIEIIDLELIDGTIYHGTWQAEWLVHDTEIKNYITTITATNIEGLSSSVEVSWSDPTWTSPSAVQSDCGATNVGNLIDGNTGSYAYHMTDHLHYVVFDMGQDYSVSGARCFTNGPVQTHRIYVSGDTSFSDEEIVSTDHCFPDMNNAWTEKTFTAKTGRYIKFEIYRTGTCSTSNYRWDPFDFYEFEAYCAAANSAPDVPTLSSPSDGATGQSVTPDLVFNYSDTELDTCTKFDLKVDNDSGFTSPEVNVTDYSTGGPWASGGTITYSVSSGLSGSTKYYWKVRVYDGTSWSDWSDGSWDFTTVVVYNKIVSKGDDAYSLIIDSNLNILAYVNNQSITTPITKQWHYVVSTYDGSTQKLYVDGILKASASLSGAITTNATNIKIGDGVPGKIDDIKIYAYARTADEIRLDYNAGFAARFGPADKTCSEDPASCMDNGLVASYDFDEGDGQTLYNAAATGSVNDGTLMNNPTWTTGAPAGDSSSGGLEFDGTDDYVDCGSHESLDNVQTIEMWIKPGITYDSSLGVNDYIFEKSNVSSQDRIKINFQSGDGRLRFWTEEHNNGIKDLYSTTSTWTAGIWYHLIFTWDITNGKRLYVNAVMENDDSGETILPVEETVNFTVGAISTGASGFNGSIDGVKIYNRALSAEEIRYHYNRGGPVAHWRMDEGEGSTAYDSTDNNNDGTLHLGTGGNTATSTAWVTGKHGSALEFDGTDDYVEVPDHSSLDITGGITLAAWVNDPPPEKQEIAASLRPVGLAPCNDRGSGTAPRNDEEWDNSEQEQYIELQKPGMFHYGAKAAKNIQNAKPLIYSDNDKSISFKPVSLQWSNNQNQHTFIQQEINSSEARIIDKGIELTGKQDKKQVKGVVYEDAFGKGIDVGALAYNSLWRKILKIDSLDNLGSMPEQAEYLEIEFEMETDFDLPLGEITENIKLSDNSWLRTAKAWDSYQEIEFRDEMDENGDLVNKKTNEIPIKSEIREKDDKIYFVKMIPIEWLKTAQFPIYSDADITYGTASEFEAGITKHISVAEIATNKFVVAFQDDDDDDKGKARVATVSGTTITWGTVSEFQACPQNPWDWVDGVSVAKLSTDKFVVTFGYTFLGTDFKARAATVSGTTITWGTASEFGADNSDEAITSVAQLGTDKFVVGFRDEIGGTQKKGKARVATVSGTTITWGTESEFIDTENIVYISVAKLDTDKFVVGFNNYQHITIGWKGKARAATVSGTTISWGTTSEFESGSAVYNSAAQLDTDKFVLGFRDVNDSNKGKARVATVSGTTITWGTEATFEAGTTNFISCVAIDALHFVVTYEDDSDTDKGKSNYCSVSGTTITPGTPEVFETGLTQYTSAALISSGKIVIGFQDDGDADKGKAIIGDTPANTAPDVPTLSSPSDGATDQSLTLDLVFNYSDTESNTCTKFDLKVDNDSGFTSPEINETDYSTGGPWASGGTITYSVSSGLFSSTKYYWKVRVYDGMNWSNWSDGTWDFTTLTYNKIISKGDDAYSLLIDSNLNVAAYVNNQPITTPITKKWHYVVSTYDGSTQKLYVDGILKASASLSGAITTNATNIKIGEKVPGKIDDVRVYNYARTPAQIQMDYNAGFATHLGPSDMTCSEDPASCMDNGLVASYDFDEGDGQTLYNAADTGSVNNGTLGSTAGADTSDPKWINSGPTPVGSALDFDGSSDYVALNMFYNTVGAISEITISAWVKIPAGGGNWSIVDFDRSEYYTCAAGIPSGVNSGVGDYVGWHTEDSSSTLDDMWSTGTVRDDTWHFITWVYDGTDKIIYIDGEEDARDNNAHSGKALGNGTTRYGFIGDGSEAAIFDGDRNDYYFEGQIDNVRIYNRACSAEEIRYHYNRGAPVAHWRMDEGEGSIAYDETSNNNDGTLGGGTAAYEPTWVEGKHGGALDFDGSNDYIDCGAGINIAGGNFTLCSWFKTTGIEEDIIGSGGITVGDYLLMSYSTKLRGHVWTSSNSNSIDSNAVVNDGNWYFGCQVVDDDKIYLYINGSLDNSQDLVGTKVGGTGTIIGNRDTGAGSHSFNGTIDDVRIYNYARTPAQILMDYNAGFSTHLK